MSRHQAQPYQKETEIIEFSTRGPSIAFACFTVGQIARRIELDVQDTRSKIIRNVGVAFECTGVGLLVYIVAPYCAYYLGFRKR